MTSRVSRPALVAALAIPPLLALAVWLQVVRDGRTPLPLTADETLYLSEKATSRVVFSYRSLAADLYWIRAIQYYGGHSHAPRRPAAGGSADLEEKPSTFDLMYPLLDITTTLDPRFNIAYRFGAIFLAEPYPYGPGRADLAIALLQRAVRVMPEKWQYWEDIGFVYYWDIGDYERAAEAFLRGADRPGAPWWLRSLAATTLAKGGQRGASRLLWRQLYETATDARARDAALRKLAQLDALDQIEALQRRVDLLVERTGQDVATWAALVAGGGIGGVPLDPAGVPYELHPASHVQLSPSSPLFPLPVEPSARRGR